MTIPAGLLAEMLAVLAEEDRYRRRAEARARRR